MRIACIALLVALPLAVDAQPQYQVTIDDFETDTLGSWQSSQSPEYYQGGEGREGLQIVDDPDHGRVLQARIAFVDDRASEPRWITRFLEEPIPVRHVLAAHVRYRITGTDVPPIDSLRLRLRTAPDAFTDYELLPESGVVLDEWQDAAVDVRANMPLRNVYRTIFGEIQQVTLRLDDIDDHNAEFLLLVDEITLTVEEAPEESYRPADRQLRRDHRLDVLLLTHSTAGFYDLEEAARAIDPDARVDRYLFRGLHFPLWGLPESLDELLGYDLIVMVDVDPWVLSADQARWLADLVHSGAGMVFFGGPETLTHAQQFRLPLREALPVTFESGAPDLSAGGTPTATDHAITAGLPAQRLGQIARVHDVAPRAGAEVPLTVGGRPLVVCAEFGSGRVALVNAWTELGGAREGRFFGTDLADDLMRSLLRWAADRVPEVRLVSVELPPESVVAPRTLTVRAQAAGPASAIRLRVGDEPPRTAEGAGPASFDVTIGRTMDSERTIPCALEALDAGGEVADRRDFAIEALSPLGIDVTWAAHQYTFEPGAQMQFEVTLNPRGLPSLQASGSSVHAAFAGGALPLTAAGLGDVWVVPPGGEDVLHDQSGPADVESVETRDGLLPVIVTTGVTRADRESMSFGDDPRIQRVTRTARVQPDGSVRLDYHYEFLQDVQVHRISTLLTLPAAVYAGLPFTARQREGASEDTLPAEAEGRLFDGHGLDLTVETAGGPLRIQVPDEGLHVWMQDLRRYDMPQFRLEIEAPFEAAMAQAGDTYDIPIVISGPGKPAPSPQPEALSVACTLIDDAGRTVLTFPAVAGAASAEFDATLPDLRSGEYELAVTVGADGEPLVSTSRECHVVDPLRREDFFPIMSVMGIGSGAHLMDRDMIRARLDDMWAHGMNAAAGPNARNLARPERSHVRALQVLAQSYAQRLGMAAFYEYHRLTLVNRDGPTEPSVFDPAHREALREYIEPQFDVCDRTARCLSIKIIDEPHIRAEHLNCGERCREAFRERYGAGYVPVDEVGEDIAARWRLSDFLGYYVDRAYAMTEEIRDEHSGDWDLLLTFNSPGLGYGRGYTSRQDIRSWGQHAGMNDFDIYPYFYPASQKLRMVQADFGLSMMRAFARDMGTPWGFYVELDDRNWPYQQNPKEASAECAFTAIAQGADYLNTFIHRGFGTGVSSRPERWEEAGKAFRAIRRVGPLLTRLQRPPARVAMIYPMGQAMVTDGHRPAQYTFAAMRQGFGMSDAVSSELELPAQEAAQLERDAFVLPGCEILERDVAAGLVAFVRNGGTLVIDRMPALDTTGEPLDLPWSFDGIEAQPLPDLPELTRRTLPDGRGRVVMLDFDFEQAYAEAIEQDMFERAAALRRGMGLLLADATALCHADDARGQMEAGLRLGEDAALVIVVNHAPEENSATVRLQALPFQARWAVDMVTMRPTDLTPGDAPGSCSFDVRLPGRNSQMVALLPERPEGVEVDVATPELQPGGELSYRVRVLGAAARPAAGQHLLEITVIGPDGREVTRLGGSTATVGGEMTRAVAVPVNAPAGEYTITVSVPQIGAQAKAGFTVSG